MIKYLSRRALSSLIALFLFLTFMFFVTEAMIPGDFTTQFSLTLDQEARDELADDLGITQPLWQRYLGWMSGVIRGNLGMSFDGDPVVDILKTFIPFTLLVFFTGTVIAFLFGQWLGKVVAWRKPDFWSGTASVSAILLYTAFPPWLAFLVSFFLTRGLQLSHSPYRTGSASDFNRGIWRDSPSTPQTIMLYIVFTLLAVWLILTIVNKGLHKSRRQMPGLLWAFTFIAGVAGIWYSLGIIPYAMNVISAAILPILAYVLLSFGETMLIMRTSMMDTIKDDYISTARAKGLPDRLVRDKHAARNALLPVFSRLIVGLPYLLTGLVIIEDVLDWPGVSSALFNALYQQDMPVVMGALLVVGVFSAITRLILDVLYAYLDPRIRYGTGRLGQHK